MPRPRPAKRLPDCEPAELPRSSSTCQCTTAAGSGTRRRAARRRRRIGVDCWSPSAATRPTGKTPPRASARRLTARGVRAALPGGCCHRRRVQAAERWETTRSDSETTRSVRRQRIRLGALRQALSPGQ